MSPSIGRRVRLAFTHSYIVGASPRGIAVGDVNGDGRLDVITANRASSTVSVLAADPTHPGTFLAHQEFAAGRGSRAVATGDFDGDGRRTSWRPTNTRLPSPCCRTSPH